MFSVGHSRAQRRARLRQIFMNQEVDVQPISPPVYVEDPPPPPYVLYIVFYLLSEW